MNDPFNPDNGTELTENNTELTEAEYNRIVDEIEKEIAAARGQSYRLNLARVSELVRLAADIIETETNEDKEARFVAECVMGAVEFWQPPED